MSRKILIILLLFLPIGLLAQHKKFSVGLGSIYGGALTSEKVEGANGEPLLGLNLDFGYRFNLTEKFLIVPKISYEYRQFSYQATQKEDTIVTTKVAGNIVDIPTYYYANVKGKFNSSGISLTAIAEYNYVKKSSVIFGFYSSYFLQKNDVVDVNVKIGEGGLIPDLDSTYNNNVNMRNFEHGVTLGGKYYFSDKFSFTIVGTRALTGVYTINNVTNSKGEELKFFSTYAKIYFTYYF
jgi:hypothetical protein